MQLTDVQKKEVAAWIAAGAKLSEVQQRLDAEFGIRLTYMEARFLVDDLALVPKDKELPKKEEPKEDALAPEGDADDLDAGEDTADDFAAPGAGGGVTLSLDKIVQPGSLVSGKVTFSDGVKADWYIDQMGRFGLVPPEKGYRPKQEDLMDFRVQLEKELAKQGM